MGRLALFLLAAFGAWASDPPTDGIWRDRRLSKTEVRAHRELSQILARIERGDLPPVRFDFDSARINPESYGTLDLIADVLLRYPALKLRISAHTCPLGGREYNLQLSDKRASAVKTYLAQQGVPPPSMKSKGYGPDHPIADNSDEEGRRKNRRVEFRLTQDDWDSIY